MNTSITNIEQAFADRNVDLSQLDSMFAAVPDRYRNDVALFFKKMVVTNAINGGEDLDWSNTNKRKHYPWWEVKGAKSGGSGVALSLHGVAYGRAFAYVAPRHTFADPEGATHYAQNFRELDEMYYSKPKRKLDWTQITTIEQVLEESGITMSQIENMYAGLPADKRARKVAEFRNDLIQDVINGDEPIDWSNISQKKWGLYWDVSRKSGGSGVALSLSVVYYDGALADVAPRPRFSSEEKARHVAKHFKAEIEEEYSLG